MAGAMSNYLETALLNAVFRATAYTSPSKVYLALYKSDPTDVDTGTEVTGASYARQQITFAAPVTSGTSMMIQNSADIAFAIATESWGTVTHVGIRDAVTGGNLLYAGALTTAKTIDVGDQFKILTNNLQLSLD